MRRWRADRSRLLCPHGVAALLDVARSSARAPRWYHVFGLMYLLGLRRREVLELRFEDAVRDQVGIPRAVAAPTVRRGRRRQDLARERHRVRVLSGHTLVHQAFARGVGYRRGRPRSDLLFPALRDPGRPIAPAVLDRQFRKCCERAQLGEALTPEALRQSAARRLLAYARHHQVEGARHLVCSWLRLRAVSWDLEELPLPGWRWAPLHGALDLPPIRALEGAAHDHAACLRAAVERGGAAAAGDRHVSVSPPGGPVPGSDGRDRHVSVSKTYPQRHTSGTDTCPSPGISRGRDGHVSVSPGRPPPPQHPPPAGGGIDTR